MKITLTKRQAKMLKNLIEQETLRLIAEDDERYKNHQSYRNISTCEKLDRIYEKLDKALEEEDAK